jgi:hypothetical protein
MRPPPPGFKRVFNPFKAWNAAIEAGKKWNASKPAEFLNEARKTAARENVERWERLRERIWKEVEVRETEKEREKERKKREVEDTGLETASMKGSKRRRIMEDVTNVRSGIEC